MFRFVDGATQLRLIWPGPVPAVTVSAGAWSPAAVMEFVTPPMLPAASVYPTRNWHVMNVVQLNEVLPVPANGAVSWGRSTRVHGAAVAATFVHVPLVHTSVESHSKSTK